MGAGPHLPASRSASSALSGRQRVREIHAPRPPRGEPQAEHLGVEKFREAVGKAAAITDDEKRDALAKAGAVPSVLHATRANDRTAHGVVSRVAADRLVADFPATRPGAPEIVVDRFSQLPADV